MAIMKKLTKNFQPFPIDAVALDLGAKFADLVVAFALLELPIIPSRSGTMGLMRLPS
jgi:hypothetical protein